MSKYRFVFRYGREPRPEDGIRAADVSSRSREDAVFAILIIVAARFRALMECRSMVRATKSPTLADAEEERGRAFMLGAGVSSLTELRAMPADQGMRPNCAGRVFVQLIPYGEASLRRAITQGLHRYHLERNPQGKDNLLLSPAPNSPPPSLRANITWNQRLGGLRKFYQRAA